MESLLKIKDSYNMYTINQHGIDLETLKFKFTIDTIYGDTLNQLQLPFVSGETYDCYVDKGDGSPEIHVNTWDQAETLLTWTSGTIHQVSIRGKVGGWSVNNGLEKLKIIGIDQWGNVGFEYVVGAFYGCANNTYIANDIDWINSIEDGTNMFRENSLTTLPAAMTLASLTDGGYMFDNNSLTTLPAAMTLAVLTYSAFMFYNNSLTTLPSAMTLGLLTNGNVMFKNNSLTTLPAAMTLASLIIGGNMFQNNALTTLPSAMTLGLLTNGNVMFENNSLTTLPAAMTLAALTTGVSMFSNNSIDTISYSLLINNIDANNSNTGVSFNGGNSYYNSSAQTAHDSLTATKGWIISDLGLI